MITFNRSRFNERNRCDLVGDCGLGNILFYIAGTIGIATKNGYEYGFPEWNNSEFFVNPLPRLREEILFDDISIPWGFNGFNIPDNSSIQGWMQTEKYFEHCKGLIRHYFKLKDIAKPYKNTIIIHYRAYENKDRGSYAVPNKGYFMSALFILPVKRVIVVTDNKSEATKVFGDDFEIISNTPIVDFYFLANADYLVMSPSSFSWWGAWLSQAMTVAPDRWFSDERDISDMYCKDWIKI